MDQQLEILINRTWNTPWADRVLSFVSDFGAWAPWLILLLVLGALFGDFKFRAMLLAAGLAIGLSDGIGVNLLKHTVNRPRPSQVEPGVRMVTLGAPPNHLPRVLGILSTPVVTYPQGSDLPEFPGMLTAERPSEGRSFPSGHAANNMAVATVLILFYRRRGWIYLPVAIIICYSRIYTGSHWPLDVLAGILLGILGGWLAVSFLEFFWRHYAVKIAPHIASAYPSLLKSNA